MQRSYSRFSRNNNEDKKILVNPVMLKIDNNYNPCPVDDDDEIYPNGIFEFNITKMISHVQKNPESYPLETVAVEDIYNGLSSVNESHMKNVEISRP